jgi:glycosyltransferase involved in cell wall biosynthesis
VPSRIIPPGVDTQAFAPDVASRARLRAQWGWSGDVPVVGFVGRFVPEKGCGLLADALSRLTIPWRALFVGGGPEAAALTSFAEAHPGRVIIATDVTHDRVPAYLNAMDVLCAPSRTTARWREQFGRMLIEAMSCGVPVVASRSGEIPYVVQDAGVILPEDDAASWADAISSVLTSDEKRRTLAALGVSRARSEFDWPVVARRHLEFFEEIAS